MKGTLDLLRESPFFETFVLEDLVYLAGHARVESYRAGAVILCENEPADTLYMLLVGRVQLSFEPSEKGREKVPPATEQVLVRTISEPGRVVGWSAVVEPYSYRATAHALDDTQLFAFDREWLELRAEERPAFGVQLMERVLWVVGNRLRESRIRLVARRYEEEVLAIRALLAQSGAQLSVSSPLHKIPFYLENRLTLSDAFHTLELLKIHGDELERNLAGLCLDILDHVKQELAVYQQLQLVYDHVTNAPAEASPEEIRTRCCEDFVKLFQQTSYAIEGTEHLPDQPGHIFIMNHVENHTDNALPNSFRLTLDTHFVSAMILYPKYGRPPIRVIRKSRPDEYGHQKYYDRLGYIYVYSKHVDEDVANPQEPAEQRRRLFLDAAASVLGEGRNIVICPEGRCSTTEESPVRFKAGAFRLAVHVRPEPLIVPIAVAHFEKKITRTTLGAVVMEPIRLSEALADPTDDEQLFRFINNLQADYKQYVRRAAALPPARVPV